MTKELPISKNVHSIDLSNEQKAQIKKIHENENSAARLIHDHLKPRHDQIQIATKDGTFNEVVVRSLLAQTQ
jgi:Spy/CpxP family protein refolding chaperone